MSERQLEQPLMQTADGYGDKQCTPAPIDTRSYEGRFFFVDPEKAHSTDLMEVDECDVIGSKVFLGRPSDEVLRDEARAMIMHKKASLRTTTHSVVVDVAVAKSSGGLGASYPEDTVILFKPAPP